MLDISRAFTYALDDRQWQNKLAICAAIGFGAVILTPFLIGLVLLALLLGYHADLVRNLRDGNPFPLPEWTDLGYKLQHGGSVFTGILVYNLPNIFLSCCMTATANSWIDTRLMGPTIGTGLLCCVVPLLLVYNLVTWPMIALAVARYAEERNIGVFFQFGDLFDTVTRKIGITLQWVLYAFLTNLLFGLVVIIPCIGWAIVPAVAVPVTAYLAAGLADGLEGSRVKPKRA
jgi:hypothetical protein